MDPGSDLLGRLATHATHMASIVSYKDAANAVARALVDILPMDSVIQVRLLADGSLAVGTHRGPLGEALTGLPFERLIELPDLARPGALWQRECGPDAEEGSFEHALAGAGARSAAVTGFNGLGRLRGMIVLASTESVTLSADDVLVLELLAAQAVSVLRATMLVPRLRRHAATDPLTGLGHHRAFSEALAARPDSGRHALILIDVDHFKQCNDRRGHREGDRALKVVAEALSGVLRQTDAVFRIGGDEFAALVDVHTAADALEMGRRMDEAVVRADAGVSVSIGIALGRLGEPDTELRDRADVALYRVKAAGRDGVAIDEPSPEPVGYHVTA